MLSFLLGCGKSGWQVYYDEVTLDALRVIAFVRKGRWVGGDGDQIPRFALPYPRGGMAWPGAAATEQCKLRASTCCCLLRSAFPLRRFRGVFEEGMGPRRSDCTIAVWYPFRARWMSPSDVGAWLLRALWPSCLHCLGRNICMGLPISEAT